MGLPDGAEPNPKGQQKRAARRRRPSLTEGFLSLSLSSVALFRPRVLSLSAAVPVGSPAAICSCRRELGGRRFRLLYRREGGRPIDNAVLSLAPRERRVTHVRGGGERGRRGYLPKGAPKGRELSAKGAERTQARGDGLSGREVPRRGDTKPEEESSRSLPPRCTGPG